MPLSAPIYPIYMYAPLYLYHFYPYILNSSSLKSSLLTTPYGAIVLLFLLILLIYGQCLVMFSPVLDLYK
ncbi:hypothetical protein F5051DRAFT_76063 [Lentinula edodes]|nr:hypothetical protein F5051DRAFT_76063 [Lentinula edodes]